MPCSSNRGIEAVAYGPEPGAVNGVVVSEEGQSGAEFPNDDVVKGVRQRSPEHTGQAQWPATLGKEIDGQSGVAVSGEALGDMADVGVEAEQFVNDNDPRERPYAVKEGSLGSLRLHDLLHTCATRLRALGVEKSTISAILGHQPGDVTDHYPEVDIEVKRRALVQLEDELFGREDENDES